MEKTQSKQRIVIIGGGFGGVKTALELSRHNKHFDITLISERPDFWYFPTFYNMATAGSLARSDYAASLGPKLSPETTTWGQGPTAAQVNSGVGNIWWDDQNKAKGVTLFSEVRGIVFQRSEINFKNISDGLSNTFMVGEKYMDPDFYAGGSASPVDQGDDQGAWSGDDFDNHRYTDGTYLPAQDQPGIKQPLVFGSAHPAGFYMAMCDASVRSFSFDVDPVAYSAYGSRSEGDVTPE